MRYPVRIFDYFQFSLFDFPHLSSFNACEELDHLIILYPPVPCTHEYWGDPPITMVAPPLDIAIIFPIFGACFTCTIDHFKL